MNTLSQRRTTLPQLLALLALLAGCAASPSAFYADASAITDVKLCRTLRSADAGTDRTFAVDVRRTVNTRGLTDDACDALISQQNTSIAAAVVVGAAAVAVARYGGGVGVGASTGASHDYDWDWDQFYDRHFQLVWACRGIQTGQFANTSNCAYKTQTDYRWPAKRL
ncbi:MAG: hypothetical protein V4723_07230 [Pseudomonadota bacterium]